MKKNFDAIDLCKWLFSFLVMYIHLAPVFPQFPLADRVMSQGICRIAVPFFFAASGFFLFRKMGDPATCSRENRKKLLKFCGHILGMYTLWIVIYSGYYAFYNHYNHLPQKTVIDYLRGYFCSGLQQHLWYLIATAYAAPVVYLLWRGGKRTLIIGCLICEVLCCIEWPYRFLPIFFTDGYQSFLDAFTLPSTPCLTAFP